MGKPEHSSGRPTTHRNRLRAIRRGEIVPERRDLPRPTYSSMCRFAEHEFGLSNSQSEYFLNDNFREYTTTGDWDRLCMFSDCLVRVEWNYFRLTKGPCRLFSRCFVEDEKKFYIAFQERRGQGEEPVGARENIRQNLSDGRDIFDSNVGVGTDERGKKQRGGLRLLRFPKIPYDENAACVPSPTLQRRHLQLVQMKSNIAAQLQAAVQSLHVASMSHLYQNSGSNNPQMMRKLDELDASFQSVSAHVDIAEECVKEQRNGVLFRTGLCSTPDIEENDAIIGHGTRYAYVDCAGEAFDVFQTARDQVGSGEMSQLAESMISAILVAVFSLKYVVVNQMNGIEAADLVESSLQKFLLIVLNHAFDDMEEHQAKFLYLLNTLSSILCRLVV